MTVEELRENLTLKELADIIDAATPQPDLTSRGLVPESALTDQPSTGVASIDDATEAAARGDWKPAAALLADSYGQWDFRACAVANLARVAADDDGFLVAWRKASPDDAHAAVVDAAALTALAWQLRGASADWVAGFRRVLGQAETAAHRATSALPDDPTPWSTLVTIARASDQVRFAEVWQGVTKRAPLHRRAHQSALQYWSAKWAGSHEQMFTFAEDSARLSRSLSILVVQAAYEKQNDDPKVWRQPNVQDALDTLLHWMVIEGPDNVDARDDLGWAALGLVESGRGTEAVSLFKQLGPHAGGLPWTNSALPTKMFHRYRIRAFKAR